MKIYNETELNEVLALHHKWVLGYPGGKKADLSKAILRCANLRGANLRCVNLQGADLRHADLQYADLQWANLQEANLQEADLKEADLKDADLQGAELPHYKICPEKGSFIAFKRFQGITARIKIPAKAKRCNSLIGRKCRAEYIKILGVYIDGEYVPKAATNIEYLCCTHHTTKYKLSADLYYADSYDDDIRIECTHGIHFFITKREADKWK